MTSGFPLLLEIDRGTKGPKQFKKHLSSRIDFVHSKKYEEMFGEKTVTIIYLSVSEFAEKRRKQIVIWAHEVLEEHNMGMANIFRFVSLIYDQIYVTDLFKTFPFAGDRLPPENNYYK